MIVEDSLVVRQLLAHIIARDPRLILAAAVSSAEEALREITRVQPDVISMDIRLPGMDGLEATRRIMSDHPTPIVVIAGSVEDSALKISMNALRAGALSVVEKPVGVTSDGYEAIADTICTQLYIMSRVPVVRQRSFAWRHATESDSALRDELTSPQPSLMTHRCLNRRPSGARKESSARCRPIFLFPFCSCSIWARRSWRASRPGSMELPRSMWPCARAGNSLCGARLCGARRSPSPAVGGRHASDQRQPAAGEPTAIRDRHVPLGGKGARIERSRGAADRDGRGWSRGPRGNAAGGRLQIAEDESTAVVYGMPAAALRMGGVRASLPLDMIASRIAQLVRDSR